MRVLLLETEARALPAVRGVLDGFVDALVILEDALVDVVAASASREADLVVIARDTWSEKDTVLCRLLGEEPLGPPILAVSGPCKARQRVAALQAGADDFLSVPFDSEELVARARALVRRVPSRSRHARAGVVAVDFARRHASVDGRRVALTLREFDLLAALVERCGKVVTRRELARYAMPEKVDSNTVDVHVSRIREKLGAQGALIETVRGIGYRLRRSGGDEK